MAQRFTRDRRLTADEIARDRSVREQFSHRPSRKQLVASGDYVGPMSIDDYLSWRKDKGSQPLTRQLQVALRSCDKSVYAIAQASGVAAPIIQRFLSGERGITLETAGKLAAYLGLSLFPDLSEKR